MKEICYEICEKIKNIKEKYKIKNLVAIIQTEKTMLREVELLKKSTQKDVEAVLNVEMKKFSNFLLRDNIIVRRRKIPLEGDFVKEKLDIFPKKYIELLKKIESLSKLRFSAVYTDYDLIEKLVKEKLDIENIIELRKGDIVYSQMDKNKIDKSIVVRNKAIDKDFLNFLPKEKTLIIWDEDNEKAQILLEKLDRAEIVSKEELLESQISIKNLHNFLEDNYLTELYKKFLVFFFLILVLLLAQTGKYMFENKKLEDQFARLKHEKIFKNNDEIESAIKGYKNIYGLDINKFFQEIELGKGKIYSMLADKNNIEIEFVTADKKDIEKILNWKINQKAEVEYIKIEEVSRGEAKRTYGIEAKKEVGLEKIREDKKLALKELKKREKNKEFKRAKKSDRKLVKNNSFGKVYADEVEEIFIEEDSDGQKSEEKEIKDAPREIEEKEIKEDRKEKDREENKEENKEARSKEDKQDSIKLYFIKIVMKV